MNNKNSAQKIIEFLAALFTSIVGIFTLISKGKEAISVVKPAETSKNETAETTETAPETPATEPATEEAAQ